MLFYIFLFHSIRILFSLSFIYSPTCTSALKPRSGNVQCECRKLELGCGPLPIRKSLERNEISRHGILRTGMERILVESVIVSV
jgi:hypothetical protein